jgi:hypothetical protein
MTLALPGLSARVLVTLLRSCSFGIMMMGPASAAGLRMPVAKACSGCASLLPPGPGCSLLGASESARRDFLGEHLSCLLYEEKPET